MTRFKRSFVKSFAIMAISLFMVGCYFIYLKHGGKPTPLGMIPFATFFIGSFMWCKAIFIKWWRGDEG